VQRKAERGKAQDPDQFSLLAERMKKLLEHLPK